MLNFNVSYNAHLLIQFTGLHMVIGDYLGYTTLGHGAAYTQRPPAQARPAVTLEAELDPKTPHQYTVKTKPQVIPPPERADDAKSAGNKPNQNTDPVSKIFLAIADYQPAVYHHIDVTV
jgi:hypothetical protein